ncbi:cytochrome c biogenesis factor [Candidatus Methanoperedens nitroreducens]|uniref:Cytochrome c biogenesis factor n=1 Tax=Candidatus Methanoperedens nitratireducens TaxID=1392998 RepID=A0A062VBD5_9EURY|nr:cytochrome c biogenesis protein CcsA [Candidatus Methanoperedens nitroreducens]KCZ72625.1 cytochrome c biogenesis factor [Candidatus Methanoperedens nitroreducens]MDJ1423443.1 cytochrome c biogenesis protein CcsA [Candidatus Methanoperedens sp.]
MVTFGNAILYISLLVSAVALAGLLLKELKNSSLLTRFISPMIFLTAGLLTVAYLLITYYFVVGDFTYDYVWQYSSSDLPLVYKISGTWAGQPGTYLLWVWVIFLSAAWLAYTTRHSTPLARRTQIITVVIGIYFIVLTLVQTPFKLIYERQEVIELIASGALSSNFVPSDGSGLNALLINFWMIVHPPLMFIGYAAMTIPFAAAIVYLLTKEDGWEELSRQWSRFTWLFLGMGIAVGGVWAYVVLGWGGFWAWDPVETASFIPWLTLTGFLHAAALHRKNKKTFSIAAPVLAAVSFILVIYAAIVVRSGLFNSVHAFGDASTGSLLLIAALIVTLVSIALAMRRYFEEPDTAEDPGFWNKTNIFYIALLLFVVLAFISFWGITYPVFIQLTQGLKVNVASDTKNFFNVWSYPFTIILLLALGFGLNYKESEKEKQKQTLFIVAAISVISMLPRTENFYVLDHSSPFWINEPPIYKLIGSISLISIFPPLIYAASAVYQSLAGYLSVTSQKVRVKGIGLAMVHIAVVLIIFGAVISSTLDHKIERINIPLEATGELVNVGDGYGIRVVDFSTRSLTGGTDYSGTSIGQVIANPSSFGEKTVKISGKVTNLRSMEGHGTLVELTDSSGSMWVIFQGNITVPVNAELTVSGELMPGFEFPIMSATDMGESDITGKYKVQSVELEIYQNNKMIGSGIAEYLEGKGGSGTFPMVDPSISLFAGDVYVIFQGMGGGVVPLTLKIIPAINFAWIGIILSAAGIILIMAVKTKSKASTAE